MILRLKERLSCIFSGLAARLRCPPPRRAAVKGCMRNVIVVKPDDPIFREAVFILRDDYFSSSQLSRRDLLSQAKDAARQYTDSVIPPRRASLLPAVLSSLFTAAVFALLHLTGLL